MKKLALALFLLWSSAGQAIILNDAVHCIGSHIIQKAACYGVLSITSLPTIIVDGREYELSPQEALEFIVSESLSSEPETPVTDRFAENHDLTSDDIFERVQLLLDSDEAFSLEDLLQEPNL